MPLRVGLALAVLVASAAACGGDDDVTAASPTTEPTSATVTTSTTVTSVVHGGAPIEDVAVAARLVEFARSPDDETFAQLPLSEHVDLWIDDSRIGSRPSSSLRDPAEWAAPGAAGEARSAVSAIAAAGDNVMESPGPLTACTRSSTASPISMAGSTIVIEPRDIDSCSDWFGVEVQVEDGRITAVNLVPATK